MKNTIMMNQLGIEQLFIGGLCEQMFSETLIHDGIKIDVRNVGML